RVDVDLGHAQLDGFAHVAVGHAGTAVHDDGDRHQFPDPPQAVEVQARLALVEPVAGTEGHSHEVDAGLPGEPGRLLRVRQGCFKLADGDVVLDAHQASDLALHRHP